MSGVMERDSVVSVVRSAATGDAVAFAWIVATHHDDMARVGFLVCGDRDLAQEAVQAAWYVAWRKLHTLKEPERLRPWLMTVASNEARQLMRRRRRRAVVEIAVAGDPADAPVEGQRDPADRAAELDLANALRRLSVDDRTLVAMRYAVGLTSAEIGGEVGMSAASVRVRLARLLVRLREDLGDV
jgi:RNA polymerase sigma-70 factor (ECF subfamily)